MRIRLKEQLPQLEQLIREHRSVLERRELTIVTWRVVDKRTLGEIGDWYGLSDERVRQIFVRAIRKMKHARFLALKGAA